MSRQTSHSGNGVPEGLHGELRSRRRLAAVLEASHAISSSLERDVILQNIVNRVRDVIDVPEVVLFLMEADGETLRPVVAQVDGFYDEVMALRLKLGEGIVGFVAQSGRPEIVNDAENDRRSIQVPGTPLEHTALLVAPIRIKGQTVGVIAASRFEGADFEPEDLELLTILAAHCSAAIENARLYADLRSTVDELRSTQNQLIQSAKLNALGEMAGGVAHDFNNILTAILGRTQLLLRWIENPEHRQSLQVIEQTALDGAQTVRRIQEFTRVRQDEAAEIVDLDQVMREVVEMTRPTWEYTSCVQVEMRLSASRPVHGSAAELREVFTNLILNALDAMPEGGTLTLETRDEGERVVAAVRDTGIGMNEEVRSKVFDPFFTTKLAKGTGLGLSVAYGIVRRHRGEMEVESEVGKGTIFRVSLPAATEEASPRQAPPRAAEVGSMRILCVDDEKPVLEVLGELLEALGQKVETALGGPAGIEAARRQRPDVVFTDLGMPVANGWEVASTVKALDPSIRVVLVTGWGVQLDPDSARERGADFILPKPYTLEEIRRVLSAVAENRDRAA